MRRDAVAVIRVEHHSVVESCIRSQMGFSVRDMTYRIFRQPKILFRDGKGRGIDVND